jgi:hypothetical protein
MTVMPYPRWDRPLHHFANWSRAFVKPLEDVSANSGAGLLLAPVVPYASGVPAGAVPCSLVKVMNGWSAAKR